MQYVLHGYAKVKGIDFEDDGVSQLFINNKDSEEYNVTQLLKLQNNDNSKMAKITAVNSAGAKLFTERQVNGVPNQKKYVQVLKFH